LNLIFFAIVLIAFVMTAWRQLTWAPGLSDGKAPMDALGAAMIDSAAGSVTLAIGLIGVMALFLGLMKVAEAGGLLRIIARTLRPIMVRLFPDVPADHPAMGAMILNLSANALGLGNAATPFGVRAMQELDRLNPYKGTATNAMALFLAINTSSVTLLPTGVRNSADDPVRDDMFDGDRDRGSESVPALFPVSAARRAARRRRNVGGDPGTGSRRR
jgi:spore maturation protein SpmA